VPRARAEPPWPKRPPDSAGGAGFDVARARVTGAGSGLLAWTQVISDLGDPDHFADRLLAGAGALDLDQVARWLASGSERLIVIDDIDRAGPAAIELLSVIGSRLASGPAAVVATTGVPLALAPELRLAGLTDGRMALVDDVNVRRLTARKVTPGQETALIEIAGGSRCGRR